MRIVRTFAAILFLLISGTIQNASAFEVPLLTWERGREQQVVLGGGAYTANWKVTLEGNGIEPLIFKASAPNKAGYVVYSLYIPQDLPVGAYSVSTSGEGSPRTVVAGIALVPAQTKTPASSLFDLTRIVALFAFITALLTALRSRKYSELSFNNSQLRDADAIIPIAPFSARLTEAPERVRLRTVTNLRTSLFKYLILEEGELLFRLSKVAYGVAPFVGVIAGMIAGIEVQRNGGLAQTGISVFVAISILAIVDAYSGIFATIGFWIVALFTGNVSSFRDVLCVLAISLAWIGPSLLTSLTRSAIDRDITPRAQVESSVKLASAILAPISGLAIFYLGNLLSESILYIESPLRAVSWQVLLTIFLVLALRCIASDLVVARNSRETASESFYLARVSSPQTAILISFSVFGFLYIWTEDFVKSLSIAVLFSLPYFLLFISLGATRFTVFARAQRSALLESLLVGALAFVAYRQISLQPLLVDQASSLLLLITALPGIVHAGYSVICSAAESKEIIRA